MPATVLGSNGSPDCATQAVRQVFVIFLYSDTEETKLGLRLDMAS